MTIQFSPPHSGLFFDNGTAAGEVAFGTVTCRHCGDSWVGYHPVGCFVRCDCLDRPPMTFTKPKAPVLDDGDPDTIDQNEVKRGPQAP